MKFIVHRCEKINGEIKISGSKNASLPIIIASLLIKEKVILKNIPFISDVIDVIRIIESLGANVKYDCNNGILEIISKKINYEVSSKYVSKIRASYYLMGVLISRKKYFEIDYPGGCNFDNRPIDLHIDAFKKLNIEISEIENKKLCFKKDKLIPCKIKLKFQSVGATINIILACTVSVGLTIIENASIEPEVIDVINFLNLAGGCINVINNNIIIYGVKSLHSIEYAIMSDRIEAGSYLILAASRPNSIITLKDVNPKHLEKVIQVLTNMGNKIIENNNELTLISAEKLISQNIIIDVYPDFPTDLQPIICALLLHASGQSKVIDKIYPNRISHVNELNKLNGNITSDHNEIKITQSKVSSGTVFAKDLRCGFALIITGIMSEDYVEINNAEYILRGYENIIKKLQSLDIKIEQVL